MILVILIKFKITQGSYYEENHGMVIYGKEEVSHNIMYKKISVVVPIFALLIQQPVFSRIIIIIVFLILPPVQKSADFLGKNAGSSLSLLFLIITTMRKMAEKVHFYQINKVKKAQNWLQLNSTYRINLNWSF